MNIWFILVYQGADGRDKETAEAVRGKGLVILENDKQSQLARILVESGKYEARNPKYETKPICPGSEEPAKLEIRNELDLAGRNVKSKPNFFNICFAVNTFYITSYLSFRHLGKRKSKPNPKPNWIRGGA